VTSYYRLTSNPELTLDITGGIFPVMGLFLNGSMFFGLALGERVGYKASMIILQIGIALSVFISSYMPNFWAFAFFYGVVFGVIAGLCYMMPVHIGFMHFPNKR
jgi:MFS family permease